MQQERTKMCPNCDGSVAMEVSICPYCGMNVFKKNESIANQTKEEDVQTLSYEETLSSLYPPPYKPKVIQTSATLNNLEEDLENETNQENVHETGENKNEKGAFVPTTLFWLGINILLFSILLLIFSEGGFLYLKWNAKYWFLYSIISIPLLYFGFKGLQSLE